MIPAAQRTIFQLRRRRWKRNMPGVGSGSALVWKLPSPPGGGTNTETAGVSSIIIARLLPRFALGPARCSRIRGRPSSAPYASRLPSALAWWWSSSLAAILSAEAVPPGVRPVASSAAPCAATRTSWIPGACPSGASCGVRSMPAGELGVRRVQPVRPRPFPTRGGGLLSWQSLP